MEFVKCASKSCKDRDFYPNQVKEIEIAGVLIPLCQDCTRKLYERLREKWFLNSLYKTTMTLEEINRMHRERGYDYARSEVGRWSSAKLS